MEEKDEIKEKKEKSGLIVGSWDTAYRYMIENELCDRELKPGEVFYMKHDQKNPVVLLCIVSKNQSSAKFIEDESIY